MNTNTSSAVGGTRGSARTQPQRRSSRAISSQPRTRQAVEVTPERIHARAYEIFEARSRNGRDGDQLSDWLQAEQELNGSARGAADAPELEVKVRGSGDELRG